ncbi:SUMO-interacting motif-containing protein 1 [Symphorus nematophorus]
MADVITLSSDSDKDDSDVEIVGSYSNIMTKTDPLPLTAVRVQVDALKVNGPTSPADSPCTHEGSSTATSKEHITREDERDNLCSSTLIASPTSPPSSQDKAQGSLQGEALCSNLEPQELDQADSRQNHLSDNSSPHSPTTELSPSEPLDPDSLPHTVPISQNLMRQVDPSPTSEHTQAENLTECQSEEVKVDEASNSPEHCSIPRGSPLSVSKTEDMDDRSGTGTYRGDLGVDSPVSFLWQEGSDGEQVNVECRFDMDFRAASREDRHYVCPVTLRKIMSGPAQALIDVEDEGCGTPEMLCRQSLSLVYSTIDENYPEGTLQLLSDLLQPGYYPPKDITSHLLRGILLDLQCPYHLCVQAFNLLIRTQRHHMADKTTVPWDWELLTSVMASQDQAKRHRCEVVRMLLEYVVQTLEDDFQAKSSTSALHHSIAKTMLSCDQQFPRVRDVIKWLFSAIVKSTEHVKNKEASKERDEQVRMVSIFQRMLSLALEVDRSPALNCAKLSQELFHMLLSSIPLRAHRMLLLESLQSKLLRCKLLEHLLDYACPLKISLPMSLSLLLHFMKNCTLAPDPTDGTETWQRWEELIHLLWMLLLSYNKAMKGYLCSSVTEQRGRVGTLVFKRDDMISKTAVQEAVEAFLSRSQADIGQALPLHVEESLTYLQDHLLDVCQC